MLWMSSWYNKQRGLVHYDPYQDKILRAFGGDRHSVSNTDLNGIWPDKDYVWMATNSGGLCCYEPRQDRFECFSVNAADPESIWYKQLSSVMTDRFGNLWAGTTHALYRMSARRKTTELIESNPYSTNSLIARPATAAFPVSDALMAFGTMGGLSLYNRYAKSFLNIHLPAYNDNNYNDQITAFAPGAGGSLWISTWSGLFRLDARTGAILEYFITHDNAGPNHPEAVKRLELRAIRRLYRDRTGMIWLANFGNQVWRFSDNAGPRRFEPCHKLGGDGTAPNDRAECFLDLDDRYFLFGTFNGLVRYDRRSDKFAALPVVFPGIAGPVRVISLARSKNGDVLAVANGKPFHISLSGKETAAVPLPVPPLLADCQHIIEDRSGAVWVTSDNGLGQIVESTGAAYFYDSRYYLKDNHFSVRPWVVPVMDNAGNLYFGGSRGVNVLDPARFLATPGAPPPVRIVALKINDQALELDSAIHRKTVLRLPYYQNNLAFEFAALGSPIPALNRFAYRLDDDNWIELSTKNTLNFSNLSPGNYTLQVKAADSEGVWNETGAVLHIVIRPPWWRSAPMLILYALLLAGGVYTLYRFQLRQKLALREAEQLRELDGLKSRFFANISHEFRTPLTVILGMTERLARGKRLPEKETAHSLGLIRRNARNLLRLISQILDLAKLESGKLTLQPDQADIVAFSRYIVESLHSLSETRGVSLQFEAETAEIWMDFDLEKMQSILFNLLSNALKFTPSGGRVQLQIGRAETKSQQHCRITVRDTGVGIPPEKLERIFDRFYRVEESSTRQADGTGIGLAFTRELVRLMGGEIRVESRPGVGTSFTAELPIRTEAARVNPASEWERRNEWQRGLLQTTAATAPLGEKTGKAGAGALTLLIVEDNEDVRQYIFACVSEQYRVLEARDGQEGIDMALEHTPDLIVSDVMMPEKNGLELCQTLKSDPRSSHIPIVLLTAKASVESRIAGLSRGADAYLSKPFHREELLLTMANLLQAQRVLQERLRTTLLADQAASGIQHESPAIAPEERAVLEMEDAFVQKMRRYVEENIGKPDLSMDELSRAMTMSYQNLHRKLTAVSGLSPVQFIRHIRLQKAMLLLQGTRLSIADVAFEVGFSDPKYFSRVFTEEFGRPPTAVREGS
ncbi:MAG: response regulator, partial [Saprospiraceae bacterium]|nr:response regulator [Saprospiraceae bacterium]